MSWSYFINPGDGHNVRPIDRENCANLKGDLYRTDGVNLERYSRDDMRWYALDKQAQNGSVPIKVLNYAGLYR